MNTILNMDSNVFCCGLLLLAFVFSLPFGLAASAPRWPSRKEAEAYLEEVEKDLGLRPYTKEELRAMEQEERQNYNSITRAQVFWSAGDTYIDYDGNIVDMNSNTIVGRTKPPSSR